MIIGFFTDTYFPQISGVATSIKTLKDELEKKGHQVLIFTTSDPQANASEDAIIRMPSVPFVSFKDRRIVVSGMLDAYEKAKEYDLDIIHTHTEFGTGVLGKYIAKRLGIPVVHTYHTMYEDYLHYIAHGKLVRPYHVKQASRVFCRNLSGIICPSERVVEKLRQYQIYAPMSIIPTGVALEKFETVSPDLDLLSLREEHHLAADTILLLSLSRLSYEKNIQALIKGLPAILAELPTVKLLIVGAGPYLENLQQLVTELLLTESVVFVGEVDNEQVGRYYRGADFFVNASASESQGLTYIEALAAHTKVVAKGNDYLAQLIVADCLGVTFEKDEDFSAVFLAYHQQEIIEEPAIRSAKLYDISSVNFGNKIEQFYYEAQNYYDVFIGSPSESKTQLPLRLFKKKDQQD